MMCTNRATLPVLVFFECSSDLGTLERKIKRSKILSEIWKKLCFGIGDKKRTKGFRRKNF